jgi:environmental stress-induced protein Ves
MMVLRESGYSAVPWKNGGGSTREIYRVPADAAAFDWRLSLATIDRGGPFSSFEGYERTLVLVRGAGVELDFGQHGGTRLAAPGEAAAFEGAWETTCTLLDGPSTDLNLIVSRERAEANVRVVAVTAAEVIQTAGWRETLACCISGSVRMKNAAGDEEFLDAADTARCFAADGIVTCSPQTAAPALLFIAALRQRT